MARPKAANPRFELCSSCGHTRVRHAKDGVAGVCRARNGRVGKFWWCKCAAFVPSDTFANTASVSVSPLRRRGAAQKASER